MVSWRFTSFFFGGEGKGGVFPDVLASFSVLDIFFRLELSWKRGVKSTSILDRNCEWLMLFLVGPLLTFKVQGRVFQWCKEGNDLDLLFQSLQSESVTSLQQSYNLLPTLRYTKIGIKDGLFWWCMWVHCKWEISIAMWVYWKSRSFIQLTKRILTSTTTVWYGTNYLFRSLGKHN